MTEKKNIDRLFQEKFKDFEVAPSDHIWENIEAELKEKKRRKVIPFWFKLSGVAAVLLIGLLIYNLMSSRSEDQNRLGLEEKNNLEKPESVATETNQLINAGSNNDAEVVAGETNAPSLPSSESGDSDVQKTNSSSTNTDVNFPKSVNPAVASGESQRVNDQSVSEKAVFKNKLQGKDNQSVAGNNSVNGKQSKTSLTNQSVSSGQSAENRSKIAASETKKESSVSPDVILKNQTTDREKRSDLENTENGIVVSGSKINDTNASGKYDENNVLTDNVTVNEVGLDTKKDSTVVATVEPNALEELLNEKENNVTAKEPKLNRWQVASSVAPIYFSSTTNGSPLDSRFESNKKSYKPTVAYGVGVKYALNKKLAVRAGISSVKLEYNTTDLVFYQTTDARQIQNVKANLQGSVLQVDSKPVEIKGVLARGGTNKFDASLNQKTGYVEVPIELSYQLIDKKFGIELIGGVSTLFLNENNVMLESPGLQVTIGEADNLNTTHFSTNIGMGFRYNILKALQANFEPMFKYQINTFSNDAGNFKPYFFGFYTGLSYRF